MTPVNFLYSGMDPDYPVDMRVDVPDYLSMKGLDPDYPVDMRVDSGYHSDKVKDVVLDYPVDMRLESLSAEKAVGVTDYPLDKQDGEYINLDYKELENFLLTEFTTQLPHSQHQQQVPHSHQQQHQQLLHHSQQQQQLLRSSDQLLQRQERQQSHSHQQQLILIQPYSRQQQELQPLQGQQQLLILGKTRMELTELTGLDNLGSFLTF
jgi:hypothetical protein